MADEEEQTVAAEAHEAAPTMPKVNSGAEGSQETLAGAQKQQLQQGRDSRMNRLIQGLLHWPFILHAALVLTVAWIMSLLGLNHLLVYVIGFIFLAHVESRHREKIVRRIRHEERKFATQKQLLSDYESVRWLNQIVEKAWPVFLEKFASQDFLAPLLPFFIAKYKPWTVQDAALQSFSLGRNPPVFAGLRAVDCSATDDDMVLEAAMEFFAADDMSAVLSVQLRKRLGGLWTKVHLTKLHVEGKVRLGVRFLGGWPFISRVRVSFESAPYLQIEARPLTNYGMDVAELPGIASWLDTMLADALEDSVVKPNMLVINVEKIANTWASPEFTILPSAESPPVAVAVVEILEATQLKPADVNGLADPFVKGALNKNRFKTSIKWKTLNPKWREEFRLPIISWDSQNRLILHVRDKDLFRDDNLGYCDVMVAKYRDGNRHEICLPLKGVKTGRLTFAITVVENPTEEGDARQSTDTDDSDHYEIIDTGVSASGVFSILRPGKAVQKKWRGRTGRKPDDLVDVPDNTLFSGQLEPDFELSDSEDEKVDKAARKRFWKWSHRGSKDKKALSGELSTGAQAKQRIMIDVADAKGSDKEASELPSVKITTSSPKTGTANENASPRLGSLPSTSRLRPDSSEAPTPKVRQDSAEVPTPNMRQDSAEVPMTQNSAGIPTLNMRQDSAGVPTPRLRQDSVEVPTRQDSAGVPTPKWRQDSVEVSTRQDSNEAPKLKPHLIEVPSPKPRQDSTELSTPKSRHGSDDLPASKMDSPSSRVSEESTHASDDLDSPASPGRRSMRMRDRAKNMVKQAEKTAVHLHSIWKRRSMKHRSNKPEEEEEGSCFDQPGCLRSPEKAKAASPP